MKNVITISVILIASLSVYGCKKQNTASRKPLTADNLTVSFPLYITNISTGSSEVGTKVALDNSGISRMYLFDTGNEGFFIADQPDINWWPLASITNLYNSPAHNRMNWNRPDMTCTTPVQFSPIKGDGFIVSLNNSIDSSDRTAQSPADRLIPNGELQMGITNAQRDMFPIKLPLLSFQNPLVNDFSNGNFFYEEHPVQGTMGVTDRFGNTTSTPVFILFDSGANSMELTTNYTHLARTPIAQFIHNGRFIEGTNITITVDGINLDNGWRWDFTAGYDIPTNMVIAKNNPFDKKIILLLNRAAFFNNDVMFDLKHHLLGLAPK